MNKKSNWLGQVFEVPLEDEAKALGLVIRQNENLLMSYFFADQGASELSELALDPQAAVYVGQHGLLGFQESWERLGKWEAFDFEQWPIPGLKIEDPLMKRWYRVDLEDDLERQTRTRISDEEAKELFPAAVSGHLILEYRLHKLLTEA